MAKRGGRKTNKARRGPRRMRKAYGAKRVKYPDTHSFKSTSLDTSLTNVQAGDTWVPKANGQTVLAVGTLPIPGTTRSWLSGTFVFTAEKANMWGQLRTMFDRYHVNGIKVRFIPEFNVNESSAITTIPTIKVVRDYDDNQAISVGDLWSRRGIERRLDKPFSVYIKNPKVLTSVQAFVNSSITNVSAGMASPYLNCGNGNVFLLGLKYAIKDWPCVQNSYAANVVLRMEVTYFFTFKQQINPNFALLADPDSRVEEAVAGEDDAVPCENIPVE